MPATGCVAVFGGSGNTGREVVAAALRTGLRVRALYRPGSEPREVPVGLEVLTGQLTAPEDVRRTLEGTIGAICVYGPRLGRKVTNPEVFCEAATANMVSGMKRLGIERLICQTGAMAGGNSPNWSGFVRCFVRRYWRLYPAIDADRDAQERVVKGSGLNWTLVRPFRISGARGKGRVQAAPSARITAFTNVRRTDLAEFLVGELPAGRFHRQVVYVVS